MLVATALADAPMAELIDRHRPVMHALVAEVYAVAAAEGVTLEPFDAFDPVPYAGDDDVAKERGHRLRSSRGCARRPRTAAASGATSRSGTGPPRSPTHYRPVLAAAARHGIPVPGLERLVAQIGELEAGAAMDEARIAALARSAAVNAVPAAVRGRRRRRRRAARGGSTPGVRSSWTTSSPTPSWRRRATTSRC